MNQPKRPALTYLTAKRITPVLADFGFNVSDASDAWFVSVGLCCQTVSRNIGEKPSWRVGKNEVFPYDSRAPIDARNLRCTCPGRLRCLHCAAVLVVLAFNDPTRRVAFEAPLWELALRNLQLPKVVSIETNAVVQYELQRPNNSGMLFIRPFITGASRQHTYPSRLAKLRKLLGPLSRTDAQFHDLFMVLSKIKPSQEAVRQQLVHAMIQVLAGCTTVLFEKRSVIVQHTPLTPTLTGSFTETGDLALAWEPKIRLAYEDGFVLTADNTLCPLPHSLRGPQAAALQTALPEVPARDVSRFVERFVHSGSLNVRLPEQVVTAVEPHSRSAKLALLERGNTLVVRLDLVYTFEEGHERAPDDLDNTLRVPGFATVKRNLLWEEHHKQRFLRDLGVPAALKLSGDQAYDFLCSRLPELSESWTVVGVDNLARFRTSGHLSPVVSLKSGEDWFSLDVGFKLKDQKVSLVSVLNSWLNGERYHQLADGSIAALPAEWLARHERALQTLAPSLKKGKKLSSWHSWYAGDLMKEAGDQALGWLRWQQTWSAFDGPPPLAAHPDLKATLRPYQEQGIAQLVFLQRAGLHCLVADEMGLGKTLQALAAVLHSGSKKPSLVIAPTSVLHSWAEQCEQFTPTLKAVIHHGKHRDTSLWEGADLIISSWTLLRLDDAFFATDFNYVILDEAQNLKNPASQTARKARKLQARHRLALTGTPIENRLEELWSIYQFLLPGYLGSRAHFHSRYGGPAAKGQLSTPMTELRQMVAPFLLRRTKAEVAPDLPPRIERVVKVTLSQPERRLYDRVHHTFRESVRAHKQQDNSVRQLHILDALTRLRQACCHPALLPFPEARRVSQSAKLNELTAILHTTLAANRRALIFSQWPSFLHQCAQRFDELGWSSLLLEGKTKKRNELVTAFQSEDGPPLFLISIKAGGTGLTLTNADDVFLLDPWWNPAVEQQATDRAHRIGRQGSVTVHRIVARDTIEERVMALAQRKQLLADALFNNTDTLPLEELIKSIGL